MRVTMCDIHWAAGFLEGEGSFTLCGVDPRIQATQVELDPLYKLVALYDGKIYQKKQKSGGLGKKLCHSWVLGGKRGAALMMTIFSLMSKRRQGQIMHVLSSWKSRGATHGSQHYGVTRSDAEAVEAIKRVLAGESMSSVARSIDVSHATISFWMKGGNRPEIRALLGDLASQIKESSCGQNHYRVTVSDDQALDAMRHVKHGESMYSVGRGIGVTPETISFWMRGLKRSYLLSRLRQEEACMSVMGSGPE